MTLNKRKYWQAILYICQQLDGEVRGKKKFAKLLYFADFDLFEKDQEFLTGDIYKALPMGPFPVSFSNITNEMKKKKALSIESIEEHEDYLPTEVYKCVEKPDMTIFSEDEKKILDRVIANYGQLNGRQLEELTHSEAPYVGTEPKGEIPYELSFYRGTNFSDL